MPIAAKSPTELLEERATAIDADLSTLLLDHSSKRNLGSTVASVAVLNSIAVEGANPSTDCLIGVRHAFVDLALGADGHVGRHLVHLATARARILAPGGRFASLLIRDRDLAEGLAIGFDGLWKKAMKDLREVGIQPVPFGHSRES